MTSFDAVVLAGGRASRLGGIDKAGALVGGRSLLDRVIDAVAAARCIVVVGGRPSPGRAAVYVTEDRPGGGPVHALAAALPELSAPRTVLLAADLPFVTATAVAQLLRGLDGSGPTAAVVGIDDRGRDQYLLAAWDAAALRRVLSAGAGTRHQALRRLYGQIRMGRETLEGFPPPWWDCDTPDALARARAWCEPGRTGGPGREAGAG